MRLAPSILAADFTRLGQQLAECQHAGADWIHVDVMDGHFVPNLTMGPFIVEAVRRATTLPIDVHLMIDQPDRYLADFARAGANGLTVHAEACPHLHRTVQHIKGLGCWAGVALNPATPVHLLDDILPELDLVLVMSVNPGFAGQRFIPSVLPKLRRLSQHAHAESRDLLLQVDGGVDTITAPLCAQAGANVLVAAKAVFGAGVPIDQALTALRAAAQG